ncbi:hypothetical protein RND81_06G102600 [Saponaria officinalis]|uniref:CCHC-type domain-containing protein n=1 Tax=Saponaria officinalis TaxID=3572 RepID=A0AAW1KA22_SAPOF
MDACTCQLLKRIVHREFNAKLIQFLMGLSDVYESVKTHVLTMEPLPPMNKALALLQKIEKQLHIRDASEIMSESTAFLSQTNKVVQSWKKPRFDPNAHTSAPKECSYCHNLGHIKSECFKLRKCVHCGRKGHAKENCFKLKFGSSSRGGRGYARHFQRDIQSFRPTAHHVDVANDATDSLPNTEEMSSDPLTEDTHVLHSSSEHEYDPKFVDGLVNTVLNRVVHKFTDKTSALSSMNFAGRLHLSPAFSVAQQFHNHDWIIDTGASDHMTYNIESLHNVQSLHQPILVSLPDGSIKRVFYVGDFTLNSNIVLHNVLVVSEFKHNLLSVGKLIRDSHMLVEFNSHSCLFQDPSNRTILASGQKEGQLYWFKSANKHTIVPNNVVVVFSNNCKSSCSFELFHARVDHSYLDKLRHIHCCPYPKSGESCTL